MEKPSFEIALEQLQQTVKRLEAGDIGLEEALKLFEEGVKLTRLCQEQLMVAEQKVDILLKSSITNPEAPVETQPFTSGR